MKIRKPSIPAIPAADASDCARAVKAALRAPEVRQALDAAAQAAGTGRFTPMGSHHLAAAEALDALFAGNRTDAESVLAQAVDGWLRDEDLADDFRRSQPFAAVLDSVVDAVCEWVPSFSRGAVAAEAREAITGAFLSKVAALDRTGPLDLVRGVDTVVCHVPGYAGDIAATMTSFWTDESSSLTAVPDAAFARFLRLANVSSGAWLAAVEEVHGVRLDREPGLRAERWEHERAQAWAGFRVERDHCLPSFGSLARLVEAVDSCPFGFTPLVAFAADAAGLCERDWDLPMSVEGGVLGLHDFVNGSGDPLRFEHRAVLCAAPREMVLGEAVSNDFGEVHGFVRRSFRSMVRDVQPEPEAAPAP